MNKDIVWGKAGDEVKMVADHGKVLIVEGANNERFPVSVLLVTSDEIPVTDTNPIVSQLPGRRANKTAPAVKNQNELF